MAVPTPVKHEANSNKQAAEKSVHESGKKKATGKGKEKSAATVTQDEKLENAKEWDWVSVTHSSASKYPHIFTKDGR